MQQSGGLLLVPAIRAQLLDFRVPSGVPKAGDAVRRFLLLFRMNWDSNKGGRLYCRAQLPELQAWGNYAGAMPKA